ncbi:hypothetical protein [Methanofollis fontis]|uniref:Uncharacterized protein n=1 Tax=Methanofollis fontis TaxID=2052832 RepID=A0A483CSF3_9EURY|nr:hypothetical protein [Methanofollis fontis]TAJ44131.1 hypothetical protein CUJ86_08865 [Methanofollis fontis]
MCLLRIVGALLFLLRCVVSIASMVIMIVGPFRILSVLVRVVPTSCAGPAAPLLFVLKKVL